MAEGERTYFCIDMKTFYASVECAQRQLDPFETNLVVADESRTDKTICLAVQCGFDTDCNGATVGSVLGIMGGTADLSIAEGFYYVFASLPIALGGWYSAIRQGEVAVAGISVLAKQPDAVGKAVISASFVELYAILALLISILLVL